MDEFMSKLFPAMLCAVFLFTSSLLALPGSVNADESKALTDTQSKQVEQLIEKYLEQNPEVVVRAIRKYQHQQEEEQRLRQVHNLENMRELLEQSDTSPVRGNPDGDVTLVEFFDYRCGYCKRVHSTVTNAVNADGNVRLVYKEFPVLGPESVYLSRASLAVFFTNPDKYPAFHDALMTSRGQLNPARVMTIAEDIGLNAADIETGMKDPRVDEEIQRNIQMARSLGINGTPGFVIGAAIVPGAVDEDTLKSLIAQARQG
jgi:protein-disulfide isomerase